MSWTEQVTHTPTRRAALRLALTTLAAGSKPPARAGVSSEATPSTDAERIALCTVIIDMEAARRRLYATRHTLADEQRTEPVLQALYATSEQAMVRLVALPGPPTLDGLQAMARAALAIAPRDWDGEILSDGDADWLAFHVVAYLAQEGAV